MGSDIDYALGTDFGERFEPDKVIDAAIAFANGDVFPVLNPARAGRGLRNLISSRPKTVKPTQRKYSALLQPV